MADQYRDSCVDRRNKKRKEFAGFPVDPIRVSFYDKDGTKVNDVTRSEANCIASLNPDQLFYFQDGNGVQRELIIKEVNELIPILDLLPTNPPPCPTNPQFCGPPKVEFFGGTGMGALANAIVSPNSSSIIGFDILNPGFNYLTPPFAELVDECGSGSGGKLFVRMKPYTGEKDPGRRDDSKGGLEVKDIVITAPGDGYLPIPDGSKGGNGRVTDPAPDPDDPTPPALPIVTFTASKYLINSTETVRLSWSTQNVTTVNITEIGNNVELRGSREVIIDRTKTYVLTAFGPGGTKTSQVTISLIPTLPPDPPVPNPAIPPSVTFVSSKYEVNDGEQFDLTWQTSNATTVVIDRGVGAVGKNGKKTLTIGETTTYTLTATGAGGTTTQKVTVIYKSPVIPPAPPTPVTPGVPTPVTPGVPTPVTPGVPTPVTPVTPVTPGVPTPVTPASYKVLMCLDDIYVEDGGFGFVPGDTATIVPENGSQVELVINERGEIAEIKVLSKGCGYIDLPDIVINSETGYNAKLFPVLSATRITDEQALFDIPPEVQLVSVVDCVGIIPPKREFDRVPR